MSVYPALTDEQEKEILRKCWYTHDAHWFRAVAQEFGLEAANPLNRRVCRALGEAEMRRLVRALGIVRPTTMEELVEMMKLGMRFFAPPPLAEFDMWVIDEQSYGVRMKRCFIHENVTKAGIAPLYECAASDRLQGWHDALGLPLAEDPPLMRCPKVQGRECHRVATIQPSQARSDVGVPSMRGGKAMNQPAPEEKQAKMSAYDALTDEQEKEILRKCWYSHDANWFRAVAQEFGLEVANRLNRQVIRAQGKVETRRLMKALGISQIRGVDEMIRFVDTAVHLIVGPLMEFEIRALNDHSYEGTFHRCFVHENIVKAGVAQSYICAVFDRLQGFHDAANLPLTEEIAALPCAKAEGRECRRIVAFEPLKT